MKEKWTKIAWSNDYEVSNFGNVRSWRPRGNSKNRPAEPRILSQWTSNGYPSVTLCVNQNMKNFLVHRLVAEAFLGEIPEKMIVCHIDDDKTNNNIANLRYGTYSQNGKDAVKNGKLKSGESHPAAKLSNKDVDIVKHLVVSLGKTHKEVADIFGVARSTISGIINSSRRK